MKKLIKYTVILAAVFTLLSCGTTSGVERVSSDTVTDLSGYWNDTDVRMAVNQIINECIQSPKISGFSAKHKGKNPVVIVGSFRNMSDEHIDTGILTKQFETTLVNSGVVDFVASTAERNELRDERMDQQSNAGESTAKNLGNETGADYMLQGSIKTIVDSNGGTMARTYYILTELIDIETNLKVWMNDNSSIKKIIKRSSVRM
jgi:penicillin-binding protein activator